VNFVKVVLNDVADTDFVLTQVILPWRRFGSVRWGNGPDYERLMRPAGFALTFLSVVFAMVLFRDGS